MKGNLRCHFYGKKHISIVIELSIRKSFVFNFWKKQCVICKYFKSPLSGLRQFLATESPVKTMKNAFFLRQKLFSFSRYLSFCLDFLVVYRNGMIKKENFKVHDVTVGLTNNQNTHIAQYHEKKRQSDSEYGQLIKSNMWNVFLEKSFSKYGRKTRPWPFSEILNISISLYRYYKVLYSLLLLYGKLMATKIYRN